MCTRFLQNQLFWIWSWSGSLSQFPVSRNSSIVESKTIHPCQSVLLENAQRTKPVFQSSVCQVQTGFPSLNSTVDSTASYARFSRSGFNAPPHAMS
jgi:hypothetical protein